MYLVGNQKSSEHKIKIKLIIKQFVINLIELNLMVFSNTILYNFVYNIFF